ncbi:MAG: DUF1287 domain-containing protein [Chitinophagaceae bacterium]|nr:DUF1287 domain-containing protein [Chitinophagaceae bacterium]
MKKWIFILLLDPFSGSTQQHFSLHLANAAVLLTNDKVTYDPSYYVITYPNGDVPSNKGVCADVVIRAYRKLGIDLQERVHKDMEKNFAAYPKNWGLNHCDKNIDHRRVPNLMKFFERKGTVLPVSKNDKDYSPGEIICWLIKDKLPHIGIV